LEAKTNSIQFTHAESNVLASHLHTVNTCIIKFWTRSQERIIDQTEKKEFFLNDYHNYYPRTKEMINVQYENLKMIYKQIVI